MPPSRTAAKKAPKGKDAPKEEPPKEAPAEPPKGEVMLLVVRVLSPFSLLGPAPPAPGWLAPPAGPLGARPNPTNARLACPSLTLLIMAPRAQHLSLVSCCCPLASLSLPARAALRTGRAWPRVPLSNTRFFFFQHQDKLFLVT